MSDITPSASNEAVPAQDEVQRAFATSVPPASVADIERRLFRGATLNEISFDYEVVVQALVQLSFAATASEDVRARARGLAEHLSGASGEQLSRFAEFLADSAKR